MAMNVTAAARKKILFFRVLSIQQRLPLLICVLLLCMAVALGWLSQVGVKRASVDMAKERLGSLTAQLSYLFGQSGSLVLSATSATVDNENIKKFVNGDRAGIVADSARQLLDNLRIDSTWILTELFDARHQLLLRSSPPGKTTKVNSREILSAVNPAPHSCQIGKLLRIGDSIYYPIIAAVTDKGNVTGYLARWRLQAATLKAIAQVSLLLGTNATLYVGNSDGSVWTNLIGPVPAPPVTIQYDKQDFFEYERQGDSAVLASAMPIPNAPWSLLIEFPRGMIMETSRRFLHWIIGIGAALVLFGILLAWITSRNITRPLNKLTRAATKMAAGDYSVSVEVERGDELGKLARAFNAMTVRVKNAQDDLERKVQERTMQLNTANKELEGFSYSVSHDLRAPLRSISGFAAILKEDYASKLDAEANRLADKIISNAKKMGQLIDDLISFSQMSGKELKQQPVNMEALAKSCASELLQHEPENKYQLQVQPMPVCLGDEALLRQVWFNLIGNAIKYSSKNPAPRIEIGYKKEATASCYFVRDNGVGFDMQYGHKLFGVFQRLHGQNEFEGLGIGLALVKRILNRHHGDISVEAALGKGAVFYFSLPKIKDHE
ncbi:sensor histidine kinase [Foetidibacter luteolus]|uniref:sensor histidine kinase n=1 Tax=Foetidibacter luteolus TaxID=2608880 RepID=UPI00129A4953|nr:ATP-binding protein [Foetidibacter luteolus]